MNITRISLKNFRCLAPFDIVIKAPIVLITGVNGTGKTTILEALYYACYLRSFRTHAPRELVAFKENTFVINVFFDAHEHDFTLQHTLHVAFDGKKKLVKVDGKAIQTYKDLLYYYRVVSITTDDMQLISGAPEERRAFLDTAVSLLDYDYALHLKQYRVILQNKNALLRSDNVDEALYHLWNEQLWEKTCALQKIREELLAVLQEKTSALLTSFFGQSVTVSLEYKKRGTRAAYTYKDFMHDSDLFAKERVMHRSLFGIHLDDIGFKFDTRHSKLYASRGQQKLTIFMVKAAFIQHIMAIKGPVTVLLDDFMGEFDPGVLDKLYELLKHLGTQLIFTSPSNQGYLEKKILQDCAQEINLGR